MRFHECGCCSEDASDALDAGPGPPPTPPRPDESETASYCDEDLTRPLSIFNIHFPSPPQGADKTQKVPSGESVFDATDCDAIKALLK